MITDWITDIIEAPVLKGFTRAFTKVGLVGQAEPTAAFAELNALMGRPLVIETNATDADEDDKPTKRRSR